MLMEDYRRKEIVMTKGLKIIIHAGAAAILIALLISNFINYNNARNIQQQVNQQTNAATEQLVLENKQLQNQIEDAKANQQNNILSAANNFIDAYYHNDTSEEPNESIFDEMLTQSGKATLSGKLKRAEKNDTIRVVTSVQQKTSYVKSLSDTHAQILSVVSVVSNTTTDILTSGNTPFLIKLDLQLENDQVWRIDNILFEQSLYGVSISQDVF